MNEDFIIFTNGCFDILHIGHVKLLEFAASHGRLVVGLNSDESVRRLKGLTRPINSESDRKTVLEALRVVSEVIIFDEDTPYKLIKSINPDMIVKGGDYKAEEVIGSELSKVVIFPYVEGMSTSKIIETINKTSERD